MPCNGDPKLYLCYRLTARLVLVPSSPGASSCMDVISLEWPGPFALEMGDTIPIIVVSFPDHFSPHPNFFFNFSHVAKNGLGTRLQLYHRYRYFLMQYRFLSSLRNCNPDVIRYLAHVMYFGVPGTCPTSVTGKTTQQDGTYGITV